MSTNKALVRSVVEQPQEGIVNGDVMQEALQGLTQTYCLTMTKGFLYVYASFYVKHTKKVKKQKHIWSCLYT